MGNTTFLQYRHHPLGFDGVFQHGHFDEIFHRVVFHGCSLSKNRSTQVKIMALPGSCLQHLIHPSYHDGPEFFQFFGLK
jgi:hypothetical protein